MFFRILLFYFLFASLLLIFILFVDWIFGHRLLIPIARLLKFKSEDIERTANKIDGIMGGSNRKSKNNKKKN